MRRVLAAMAIGVGVWASQAVVRASSALPRRTASEELANAAEVQGKLSPVSHHPPRREALGHGHGRSAGQLGQGRGQPGQL